ncbi:hypothetical protein D9M69_601090 [compost metagenome]
MNSWVSAMPAFFARMCAGISMPGPPSAISQSANGLEYFSVMERLSSPISGKSVRARPVGSPAYEKYDVPALPSASASL